MSEKLMTLRELCEYLKAPEERVISLVEEKSLPAYKIGGELLRFRKEQIDAMRSEIDARIKEADDKVPGAGISDPVKRPRISGKAGAGKTFCAAFQGFFFFYHFFFLSPAIIFRG